jgi:hypothetical protein
MNEHITKVNAKSNFLYEECQVIKRVLLHELKNEKTEMKVKLVFTKEEMLLEPHD